MTSNVESAVAPKVGEYNLIDSQEQSEKSCCQKVKEAVYGSFKTIGDFFEKVVSFLKEHCCCGEKLEEAAQQVTAAVSEGEKTEGKLEVKPGKVVKTLKEEQLTEEESEATDENFKAFPEQANAFQEVEKSDEELKQAFEKQLEDFEKEFKSYMKDEMYGFVKEEIQNQGLSEEDCKTFSEEQEHEFMKKVLERLIATFVASKGGKSLIEDDKKLAEELLSFTKKSCTEEQEEKLKRKFILHLMRLCK